MDSEKNLMYVLKDLLDGMYHEALMDRNRECRVLMDVAQKLLGRILQDGGQQNT